MGSRSGSCRYFADARRLPAEDALALDHAPAHTAPNAQRAHRRADAAAHRQFRRSRSARGRARRSIWCRAAGRGAAGRRRSRHPAGLEGDDRRSRGVCAPPAGTSTSRRIVRRGGACSASAAATRCWAVRSPIRTASRARRRGRRASACSTSRPCCRRRSALSRCAARRADGAPFAGYEMHIGETDGPDCARPFARLADGRPTARSRRRPGDRAPMCTACSPTTASARRGLRGLAAAATMSLRRCWSSARSTRSPRISTRISISTRCSR